MTQDPTTVAEDLNDLIGFVDASPTPYHAVATAAALLDHAGFTALDPIEDWGPEAAGPAYVVRDGALVAWCPGRRSDPAAPLRMIGAHTDSPGLRLKPRAAHAADGLLRLGVEVYGGPILATFADRDLSLAGRVSVRQDGGHATRLLHFEQPLVRLPNLAIHMNREVNEQGLKFNKQTELPLLFGAAAGTADADAAFRRHLAAALAVESGDVLTWELNAYDTQKGSFWGADGEFVAARQLDNLASCHAALSALLACREPEATCVCALFDHEEVGSESASGRSDGRTDNGCRSN